MRFVAVYAVIEAPVIRCDRDNKYPLFYVI